MARDLMAVGNNGQAIVFARDTRISAPEWRSLAGLLSCASPARGRACDEETQHADAAPNCGLRRKCSASTNGASKSRREALRPAKTSLCRCSRSGSACRAFAGCVWPVGAGDVRRMTRGRRAPPSANSVLFTEKMPRRRARVNNQGVLIWNEGMDASCSGWCCHQSRPTRRG